MFCSRLGRVLLLSLFCLNPVLALGQEITEEDIIAEFEVEDLSAESVLSTETDEIGATEAAEIEDLEFSSEGDDVASEPETSAQIPTRIPTESSTESSTWKGMLLILVTISWLYVLSNWVDLKLLSMQPKKRRKFTPAKKLPEELLSRVEKVCRESSSDKRELTESESKRFG